MNRLRYYFWNIWRIITFHGVMFFSKNYFKRWNKSWIFWLHISYPLEVRFSHWNTKAVGRAYFYGRRIW